MVMGRIHSTESFGSVDGPGVRFVIFLQGCALRCQYCHNPDTWDKNGGEWRSADELLDIAERYRGYWGREGGITVSGGEPLLQIDFLTELCCGAEQRGISVCIDTAGQPFTRREPFFSKFEELCRYVDCFLLDIKHIDRDAHVRLTGQPNDNILDMFRYLSAIGKPVWVRYVLVPGITDDEDALNRAGQFLRTLNNVEKTEVLPYHSFGVYKWEKLGIPYTLRDVLPPSPERVARAQTLLSGGVPDR